MSVELVAAGQEAAVTGLCQRFGIAVYFESGHQTVTDVASDEQSMLVEASCGISLRKVRPDGVVEAAMSLPDDAALTTPVVAARAERLRHLPVGRVVHRSAGGAAPHAELRLPRLTDLRARERDRRSTDLRVRLRAEVRVRRVVVGTADHPAVGRTDSWWRLTCFVDDAGGRSLGKATVFGTDEAPVFDADMVAAVRERAVEQASRLDRAPTMQTGPATVVFAPAAAAVLIHEVVGHLLEADVAGMPALATQFPIGDRISSAGLHVANEGTEVYPWGGAPFDDAGTPTGRLPLIVAGQIVARLAAERRAGYDTPLLPRMSTLLVEPTHPTRSLIDVPEALLVRELSRGSLDQSTGRCVLRVREAALIRAGAVGVTVRGGVIVCAAADLLGRIDAVGSETEYQPMLCTKGGQRLPVGVRSPAIRVRRVPIVSGG